MEEQLSDNQIKLREIEFKELELKSNRLITIVKTITTGIVVTLVPAIINYQIQQQEIEIKRLEGEIVYLDKFSDNVVEQEDLAKRKNFVEYLATIAHSKESRQRWNSYLEIVEKLADKQKKLEQEIIAAEEKALESQRELDTLKQALIAKSNLNTDERDAEKKKIMEKEEELLKAEAIYISSLEKRDQLIENSSLTSDINNNRTYFVGLQTFGVDNDKRKELDTLLSSQNYSQDKSSASYNDRKPQWFASENTVFYYSSTSRTTAERLARLMKQNTGENFAVQRGAGLGVDINKRKVTFFIHYMKE